MFPFLSDSSKEEQNTTQSLTTSVKSFHSPSPANSYHATTHEEHEPGNEKGMISDTFDVNETESTFDEVEQSDPTGSSIFNQLDHSENVIISDNGTEVITGSDNGNNNNDNDDDDFGEAVQYVENS